jgi:Leucine-rich repeat (LRR) protein
LPIEASHWEELTVLNLKNNKITDIGTTAQFWPKLERLFVGINLITSIPFEIGTCVNLIELDFSQ